MKMRMIGNEYHDKNSHLKSNFAIKEKEKNMWDSVLDLFDRVSGVILV